MTAPPRRGPAEAGPPRFAPPPFTSLQEQIAVADGDLARRALTRPLPLDTKALAALLSPAADGIVSDMAAVAAALTRRRFGRTIQLYAPLYLSSHCANRCAYCGFSAENAIARRTLSLEETLAEAEILRRQGFRHLLLVAGEAPARLGTAELETVAGKLAGMFASVAVEVQPLSIADYRRLFAAGVSGVTVYQETYDEDCYRRVHLAGKKSDYCLRLEIPARAAAAGMREVGIGALLGLSDWRAEGLALGLHLAWLRRHFWQCSFTLSFPRLRPATGGFAPLVAAGEEDLARLIFALRIFDPDLGIVLSTREEARFRDGMLGLGPSRYSAGSCTVPGGYSRPDLDGAQFSIGDHRPLPEVAAAIAQKGLDPVMKDWDGIFQQR